MTGGAAEDLGERTDELVAQVTALSCAALATADELDRSLAALRIELWGENR